MIHHVVSFKFKSDVSDERVEDFARDLRALAASVDGVVAFGCGTDLNLRDGNDDFAIAAVFQTEGSLASYLSHPTHLEIQKAYLSELVAEKHGVQFESPVDATN